VKPASESVTVSVWLDTCIPARRAGLRREPWLASVRRGSALQHGAPSRSRAPAAQTRPSVARSPLTLFIVDTHSATPPTVMRTPPSASPALHGSRSSPATQHTPTPSATLLPLRAGAPGAGGDARRRPRRARPAKARPAKVTARMARGVFSDWRSAGAAMGGCRSATVAIPAPAPWKGLSERIASETWRNQNPAEFEAFLPPGASGCEREGAGRPVPVLAMADEEQAVEHLEHYRLCGESGARAPRAAGGSAQGADRWVDVPAVSRPRVPPPCWPSLPCAVGAARPPVAGAAPCWVPPPHASSAPDSGVCPCACPGLGKALQEALDELKSVVAPALAHSLAGLPPPPMPTRESPVGAFGRLRDHRQLPYSHLRAACRGAGNVGETEIEMIRKCYDKCINDALEGGNIIAAGIPLRVCSAAPALAQRLNYGASTAGQRRRSTQLARALADMHGLASPG